MISRKTNLESFLTSKKTHSEHRCYDALLHAAGSAVQHKTHMAISYLRVQSLVCNTKILIKRTVCLAGVPLFTFQVVSQRKNVLRKEGSASWRVLQTKR